MNSEENRLQTFDNWPSAAAVAPAKIAKAGFFYTKHNLTVECFSCHVQITDWNYGDQVMARHRLLSPECSFVRDPVASGNVPKLATPTTAPPIPQVDNFKDEAVRLSTFDCWPKSHIVTPESLAKSGFYSLKWKDFTKCAYCDVVLVSWESGDVPDREHKRCSPDCILVKTVINERLGEQPDTLSQLSNLQVVCSDNFHELGVHEHKAPKNSKYVTYESRLQTYTNWPSNMMQQPEELASAGFYYEGAGDKVRCFHCDGGLNHWDPQDEPFGQHALWFPKCAFVEIMKGSMYFNSMPISSKGDQQITTKSPNNNIPPKTRRVTDREVEEYLSSEPALVALSIGLHVGRVKQAIKDKLEETGVPFATSNALIEATLNVQMEEEAEDEAVNMDSKIAEGVSKILSKVLENAMGTEDGRLEKVASSPANLQNRSADNDQDKSENDQNRSGNVLDEAEDRPEQPDNPTNNAITRNESESNLTLEQENRLLKEARLCKICMDAEVGIVFLPCGHLTTCITCATSLQFCPLCRSTIKATVRTFLS